MYRKGIQLYIYTLLMSTLLMYTFDEYTSLHDDFNQKFNNINNHGMSGDLCLLLFLKGQPCGGVR